MLSRWKIRCLQVQLVRAFAYTCWHACASIPMLQSALRLLRQSALICADLVCFRTAHGHVVSNGLPRCCDVPRLLLLRSRPALPNSPRIVHAASHAPEPAGVRYTT